MSVDMAAIGEQKVKSVANGETKELKSFWQDQNVAIIFFRRWGCMFCRLWAKELGDIVPVLNNHNIKLVGVGVEEVGSKEFVDGKFFDGDLYYVENISTYQALGFKRFNLVTILTSLLWKQSRDAIAKGRSMGLETDLIGDGLQNGGALLVQYGRVALHYVQGSPAERVANVDMLEVLVAPIGVGGDLKGDWVQTGGALLVGKGGNVLRHFTQTGPGEHLPNLDILKAFGLENEYNPETMANKKPEEKEECNTEASP